MYQYHQLILGRTVHANTAKRQMNENHDYDSVVSNLSTYLRNDTFTILIRLLSNHINNLHSFRQLQKRNLVSPTLILFAVTLTTSNKVTSAIRYKSIHVYNIYMGSLRYCCKLQTKALVTVQYNIIQGDFELDVSICMCFNLSRESWNLL